MKGKIVEIFDSVQGEGIYLGEKQIFVRFFGCNLACSYCDTKLDYFVEYEPRELLQELLLYSDEYHSISYTGGEPLLQKKFLKEILQLTKREGFRNYLETNGTMPEALKEVIDYLDFIAMDIKLPSSCGQEELWYIHYRFLEIARAREVFLKSVICTETTLSDFRKALQLIQDVDLGMVLVLQPNAEENSFLLQEKIEHFKKIAEDSGITACVIPQMHKIAGVR